jgi:hypothetical protein
MKITYVKNPTPIETLIERHRANKNIISTFKLNLFGAAENDVYNICQEFKSNGNYFIAGRIENRNSEISQIGFFQKVADNNYQLTGILLPMMQDPCMEMIENELVIGGTEIEVDEFGKIISWHTSFYKGENLTNLEKFAVAPPKMKDVRLIKTDQVHIFSRPQGKAAGFGTIGYTRCEKLSDISVDLIENAKFITTTFEKTVWGGANQIILLKNGLLGIVGHIAKMSPGDVRHYYGMVFCLNPDTYETTEVKIICERSDFKPGAYKREDLIDVVFLGGLVRNVDGTATLYTGLSDAEAHAAIIEDPFLEYEAMER